ncbi:MAG: HEAT repeat domain-containing protein [Nitrospirae bacterium]|nr:HEAT repeat domain-containing protein [Nitrospirota bacterium]
MVNEDLVEEISEKDIGLAKEIMKTVTKTVKAVNVYPKDNPVYQKFSGELFDRFNAFFETSDELAFDIDQYSLSFKGNEVFRSEERNDNPAMLLFADGLRQISFHKGITFEEIKDFVDILRRTPKDDNADEDDIVTLLWAKNIRNMGYTAVEDSVDDDLVIEESLIFDDTAEVSTDQGSVTLAPAEEGGSVSESIVKVGPSEDIDIEGIKNELQTLDDKFLLSSSVALFMDLLSNERDADAFQIIVLNLGKIMDMRMQSKDISGALEISKGLQNISSLYDSQKQQEMIGDILARAGSVENLALFFSETRPPEEIKEYLLRLGPRIIPNTIELLGELQDRRHRKLLCDILSDIGKLRIQSFAAFLTDKRWYLIRNIAMILGMTKEPEAVPYLGKILLHSDVRVRREAVRALDGINTPETKKSFLSALADADQSVRTIALRAIRRFRDPAHFKVIREAVSAEEFRKKTFLEKKELLETLALTGGKEALPLLEELFRKKGLLEKDETTEIRAAAAYGLALTGAPEALSMIEKETGSRKDILREACIKSLKEAKKG